MATQVRPSILPGSGVVPRLARNRYLTQRCHASIVVVVSTNTPSHLPVNLAGVSWIGNDGRIASFGASRPGFGVVVCATGELVSRDGETPSCWDRKSIAQVHADSPSQKCTVRVA